ncbi:MAG TPA: twin-arginine translocase TatA/TatE family subunit [Solirubrobacteraceae bacterium]|jgi:sec-independent protein translocase protein TatA|nr:twin-arginine translocase TatA/TatE family subunit [Solirubrobacteraceae bacterium]
MGLENPLHLAILFLIILLLFGARRLPELGRSLGEGMRGFKDSITGDSRPEPPAVPPASPQTAAPPAEPPAPAAAPPSSPGPPAPQGVPAAVAPRSPGESGSAADSPPV